MFCVVGLGNPGGSYSSCRHNAGYRALDYFADQLQITFDEANAVGMFAETSIDGETLLLVKPLTSINYSGNCIKEIVSSFDIPLQKIIVIVDDIDLPPGEIRIRTGGKSGSHNGLRSIERVMGSEDYPRIRIGIGTPHGGQSLTEYVLGSPSKEEKRKIDEACSYCLDAVLLMMKERTEEAQNLFNVKARTRRKKSIDR